MSNSFFQALGNLPLSPILGGIGSFLGSNKIDDAVARFQKSANPATTFTPGGTTLFEPQVGGAGTFRSFLSPAQQRIADRSRDLAESQFQEFTQFDPSIEGDIFNRVQELTALDREREQRNLRDLLFGQGRLATTGGAEELGQQQLQFDRARNEAALKSIEFSDKRRADLFSRALTASGAQEESLKGWMPGAEAGFAAGEDFNIPRGNIDIADAGRRSNEISALLSSLGNIFGFDDVIEGAGAGSQFSLNNLIKTLFGGGDLPPPGFDPTVKTIAKQAASALSPVGPPINPQTFNPQTFLGGPQLSQGFTAPAPPVTGGLQGSVPSFFDPSFGGKVPAIGSSPPAYVGAGDPTGGNFLGGLNKFFTGTGNFAAPGAALPGTFGGTAFGVPGVASNIPWSTTALAGGVPMASSLMGTLAPMAAFLAAMSFAKKLAPGQDTESASFYVNEAHNALSEPLDTTLPDKAQVSYKTNKLPNLLTNLAFLNKSGVTPQQAIDEFDIAPNVAVLIPGISKAVAPGPNQTEELTIKPEFSQAFEQLISTYHLTPSGALLPQFQQGQLPFGVAPSLKPDHN